MSLKRFFAVPLLVVVFGVMVTGCAEKNLADIQVKKMAEFSNRLGQANVKLYVYSGDVEAKNIKAYTETLGCNMLYAYFYPDTVPVTKIPIEEVQSAKSYAEINDILFSSEGYDRWRFASRCFSVIPIVTDCNENPVSQDCR